MLINGSQANLAVLIFSSALAWASFLSVIFFISPQSAGALGVAILYVSAIIGLVSLSIALWQIIKLKKKN